MICQHAPKHQYSAGQSTVFHTMSDLYIAGFPTSGGIRRTESDLHRHGLFVGAFFL